MKQSEKNKKSREYILSCAFKEFAEQGYRAASINTICSDGQLSKGLIYHYYAGKEELYLACVKRCFEELTGYLREKLDGAEVTPDSYFQTRFVFFEEHPLHQKVFCDALLHPQEKLKDKIKELRQPFDDMNDAFLLDILKKETLAEGITLQEAMMQLKFFEDFINAYLKPSEDESQPMKQYHEFCRKTLRTMLYGLVARK